MPRDLAAIRVRIARATDGRAKYPAFGSLPSVQASGLDWSQYVDVHGLGWQYDQTSGHDDETADSPAGQQWGMLIVPETFADEAVAAFPAECSRLTEAECQAFYDDKAHVREPDELADETLLSALNSQRQLLAALVADDPGDTKSTDALTALKARIRRALDPVDSEPGVRRNPNRRWTDRKARSGVVFKEPSPR